MNIIAVEIYQIADIAECDYAFRSYEEAQRSVKGYTMVRNGNEWIKGDPIHGISITDYKLVYTGYEPTETSEVSPQLLESIYCKFNINKPEDFKGHSLSVSDLIRINDKHWYYVDDIGFAHVGDYEWQYFGDEEFRVCEDCGRVMIDGYVIGDGDGYLCENCLGKHYTEEEWQEMYDNDEGYWTTWY